MPNTIEVVRKNLPPQLRTKGELADTDYRALWRAVFLEFAATGAFVFYACGTAVVASQIHVASSQENLYVALLQGLAISAFVYAISRISGGHLNPAVSLSMLVSGNIGVARAASYMAVQITGGIVGAALLKAVTPRNLQGSLGCTTLSEYSTPGQGVLFEFLVTCGLLFTIYGTAMSRAKTASGVAALSPIPIGYAVTIGVGIAYSFTGGSLNPARSFGPAVVSNTWTHHYIYWVGPLAAGIFVGITERFVKLTTFSNETAVVADPSAVEEGLSGGFSEGFHAIQVILEPGTAPIPMIPLAVHPKWWKKTFNASALEIPKFKSFTKKKEKFKERMLRQDKEAQASSEGPKLSAGEASEAKVTLSEGSKRLEQPEEVPKIEVVVEDKPASAPPARKASV